MKERLQDALQRLEMEVKLRQEVEGRLDRLLAQWQQPQTYAEAADAQLPRTGGSSSASVARRLQVRRVASSNFT